MAGEWSEEQQTAFDAALAEVADGAASQDAKWELVAQKVGTKNKLECAQRYHDLVTAQVTGEDDAGEPIFSKDKDGKPVYSMSKADLEALKAYTKTSDGGATTQVGVLGTQANAAYGGEHKVTITKENGEEVIEERRQSSDLIAGFQTLKQAQADPAKKTDESKPAAGGGGGGGGACPCFGKPPERDTAKLKEELNMDEHSANIEELRARYKTQYEVEWVDKDEDKWVLKPGYKGMTKAGVKAGLETYGENRLTPPATTPEWVKFCEQMTGFFSLLLWAGSILCFIGYGLKKEVDNLYLGVVLASVVFLTGCFGYLQERKSSKLMESFKSMLPSITTVVREGEANKMNAMQLVPGDLLQLKAGMKVPADIRVMQCNGAVEVDNASLTGESEPQKRDVTCTDENPLETRNLAFFGTEVVKGSLVGLVVNTGDNTVMGRIAALTTETGAEQTPINKEIHHFVLIVSGVAFFLGVSFFIIGLSLGTDLITNLVFMIGIIVANVPEGLLATVTVCMALTAHRMANNNVLVKNLEGVETLGSTSCICSDKTGTLTQNMMTVDRVVYDLKWYQSECGAKESNVNPDSGTFEKLVRCACLCNNVKWDKQSKYKKGPDGNIIEDEAHRIPFMTTNDKGQNTVWWKAIGDATESALAKFCEVFNKTRYDSKLVAMHKNHKELVQIPFNSKNKYQASVHANPAKPGDSVLVMKGAPERIWNRCDQVWIDGVLTPFTDEHKETVMGLQRQCAERGLRVLGFAERELSGDEFPHDYAWTDDNPNFPLGNEPSPPGAKVKVHPKSLTKLHFLGLYAMIDPARPQVPGAVAKCKTAGIRVIMVTGDHPVTAKAIAKDVGIIWGDLKRSPPKDPSVSNDPDPKLGPATEEEFKAYNAKHGLKGPGDEIDCPFGRKDSKTGKVRKIQWMEPRLAPAIVVPGWELIGEQENDVLWDDILGHNQIVFARTSPQQKLIIVENCQKRSEIVAVTGDGVNDAPALKKADIGVAMGIMGSDVSKEAADMILLDDNFASIVAGVEEGRLIFDNLKKSIAYTLSSNIPEIAPFLLFITAQLPLPLSTVLILCVDLGTDMVPAISMAWENAEADIMRRPPRDADADRLVTKKLVVFSYLQIGVIQAVAGFFTWFVVMQDYGFPPRILPGLGAFDSWGKHTLFCRPVGYEKSNSGTSKTAAGYKVKFRNLAGLALDDMDAMNWDELTSDHIRNFPFWDGDVGQCTYALRNWCGEDLEGTVTTAPGGWKPGFGTATAASLADIAQTDIECDLDLDLDGSTQTLAPTCQAQLIETMKEKLVGTLFGTTYTEEVCQPTSATFAALEAGGYRPYIPWKGKQSPFWNKKWLAADTWDDDILGFKEDAKGVVHFSVEAPGLFNTLTVRYTEQRDCWDYRSDKGSFTDEEIKANRALIAGTKELYEEGDACQIDTLPVSRSLGDFDFEGTTLQRTGWNSATGALVPMESEETGVFNVVVADSDGVNTITRRQMAQVGDDATFDRDRPGNSRGDGMETYFIGDPTCPLSWWNDKIAGDVTGECNFQSVKTAQVDESDDFKGCEEPGFENTRCLTTNDGGGVEQAAGNAEPYDGVLEIGRDYWAVSGDGTFPGVLPQDRLRSTLTCGLATCPVSKTEDMQHVYNLVDVRRYVKAQDASTADCSGLTEKSGAEAADCIAVSYPNFKTASAYNLDGKACESGICVNVASRMVQKEALHHAQCAYFVSIVVVQWADLVICKTRMNSIYHQGMLNPAMNFGLIFETMLAAILCYTPGVTTALGTRPIKMIHWFPGCLYSIFIFWYDEARKYAMRSTTTTYTDEQTGQVTRNAGWMERNTYY